MVKFLRRDAKRFSKFGKGKGKKASWRKPTGRDNKMREKRRGYAPVVSIGYGSDKKVRGTMEEKTPVTVMNITDLNKIGKEDIGIVGSVGAKKKIEIIKKAKEMKVELKNMNIEAFLKKLNKAVKSAPKDIPSEKDKSTPSKPKVEETPKDVPPHSVPGTRTSDEVPPKSEAGGKK